MRVHTQAPKRTAKRPHTHARTPTRLQVARQEGQYLAGLLAEHHTVKGMLPHIYIHPHSIPHPCRWRGRRGSIWPGCWRTTRFSRTATCRRGLRSLSTATRAARRMLAQVGRVLKFPKFVCKIKHQNWVPPATCRRAPRILFVATRAAQPTWAQVGRYLKLARSLLSLSPSSIGLASVHPQNANNNPPAAPAVLRRPRRAGHPQLWPLPGHHRRPHLEGL